MHVPQAVISQTAAKCLALFVQQAMHVRVLAPSRPLFVRLDITLSVVLRSAQRALLALMRRKAVHLHAPSVLWAHMQPTQLRSAALLVQSVTSLMFCKQPHALLVQPEMHVQMLVQSLQLCVLLVIIPLLQPRAALLAQQVRFLRAMVHLRAQPVQQARSLPHQHLLVAHNAAPAHIPMCRKQLPVLPAASAHINLQLVLNPVLHAPPAMNVLILKLSIPPSVLLALTQLLALAAVLSAALAHLQQVQAHLDVCRVWPEHSPRRQDQPVAQHALLDITPV